MHEFSVMHYALSAAIEAARSRGASRILSLTMKVGELTHLNPEQLRLAFEALSEGTEAEGAELVIEVVRARIRCRGCGYEGPPSALEGPGLLVTVAKCPACGGFDVEVVAGRECTLASIRVRV